MERNREGDRSAMEQIAGNLANEFLKKLEPEIHKAMVEKILDVAGKKYLYMWEHDEFIAGLINEGVQRAIKEKYYFILEWIADKKAREKVIRRAKQNGIDVDDEAIDTQIKLF